MDAKVLLKTALLCVIAPFSAGVPTGVRLPMMAMPQHPWENYLETGVYNNLALHCAPFYGTAADGGTEVDVSKWGWVRGANGYPQGITGSDNLAYCLVGTGCVNTNACQDDWAAHPPSIDPGIYTLSWSGTGSVTVRQPPAGNTVVYVGERHPVRH